MVYAVRSKIEIGKEVCNRYPGVHHWEHFDPRLLVCEAYLSSNALQAKKSLAKDKKSNEKSFPMSTKATLFPSFANQFVKSHDQNQMIDENSNETTECLVVSMFCNAENGLLVYDSYARGEIYSKLISVRIPYHFFVTKVTFFPLYREHVSISLIILQIKGSNDRRQ